MVSIFRRKGTVGRDDYPRAASVLNRSDLEQAADATLPEPVLRRLEPTHKHVYSISQPEDPSNISLFVAGARAANQGAAAMVDEESCSSCGVCVGVCPENAIYIAEKAYIVVEKCVGCGICIRECPFEAISLVALK